jgi:hypothetical protein
MVRSSGSNLMRSASSSARISRSERSTRPNYRVHSGVLAHVSSITAL